MSKEHKIASLPIDGGAVRVEYLADYEMVSIRIFGLARDTKAKTVNIKVNPYTGEVING